MSDQDEVSSMAERTVSHRWEPIEDLPEDWRAFVHPELGEMLHLWENEKKSLRVPEKVRQLEQRLASLWAIETGVIERLYTIDRGTTESLVELGLSAIQEFSTTGRISRDAALLIEDQRAALDFVFAYLKDEYPLSTSYIKELHQLLVRHQESTDGVDQFGNRVKANLIRGDWKRWPNNPLTLDGTIHEYCPPEFVQDEIDALLKMHGSHEKCQVPAEVEAAWIHHRFTQIHPFQDGNGRVARAITTMVFLKLGYLPLVIRDIEHRDRYLDALGFADRGDIAPLVDLFTTIQLKDLDGAITFIRELHGAGIAQIARSAASAARRRAQQEEVTVESLTKNLVEFCEQRLDEVAIELRHSFNEQGVQMNAHVTKNDSDSEYWWKQQIIHAAVTYKYFVDFGRSRSWIRLRLHIPDFDGPRWSIVVSFHRKESRVGVMAAIMFMTSSEAGDEDARAGILGTDREFTYTASGPPSVDGFRVWLERGLTRLLEEWQSRV